MTKISDLVGSARDLDRQEDWFVDPQGRYALFRGINIASRSKLPPYLPTLPLGEQKLDAGSVGKVKAELQKLAAQVEDLKEMGFNVVRLLVIWKAIEPEPAADPSELSQAGKTYLDCVKEVIDFLYERGMFTVIDFHQDLANEVYGGEGFPDWATGLSEEQAGEARDRLERDKDSVMNKKLWMSKYMFDSNVKATYECFWKSRRIAVGAKIYTPSKHMVKTMGATVHYFQSLNNGEGHRAVLGYEVFNEPVPVGRGRDFEEQFLGQYYRQIVNEIRYGTGKDSKAFIFFEPRTSWEIFFEHETTFGSLDQLVDLGWYLSLLNVTRDRHVVFAFHYYDPITFLKPKPDVGQRRAKYPEIFAKMCARARSLGGIPFLTEFGVSNEWQKDAASAPHRDVTQALIDMQYGQVEGNCLNSMYWNCDFYNTKEGGDNWNHEDFSVLGLGRAARNRDALARPYPMRSAAKPAMIRFDIESRHALMKFEGLPVQSETVIFVPLSIHYRKGFDVYATANGVRWDDKLQMLFWKMDMDSDRHQLAIAPAGKFDEGRLPGYTDLKPRTKKVATVSGLKNPDA